MKYIKNEIVNAGVWDCVKEVGSLANLEKELEGVGRSTIRSGLFQRKISVFLEAACLNRFNGDRERFSKLLKINMTEEEV